MSAYRERVEIGPLRSMEIASAMQAVMLAFRHQREVSFFVVPTISVAMVHDFLPCKEPSYHSLHDQTVDKHVPLAVCERVKRRKHGEVRGSPAVSDRTTGAALAALRRSATSDGTELLRALAGRKRSATLHARSGDRLAPPSTQIARHGTEPLRRRPRLTVRALKRLRARRVPACFCGCSHAYSIAHRHEPYFRIAVRRVTDAHNAGVQPSLFRSLAEDDDAGVQRTFAP